jgi:hypothetical protein
MLFIHREQPEDIAAIHEVHELAFGRPAEADLVDALRTRSTVTLSLVAVEDDRIVGHILFSPVTIDPTDRTFSAVGLGTDGSSPRAAEGWDRLTIGQRWPARVPKSRVQLRSGLGAPDILPPLWIRPGEPLWPPEPV